MQMADWQHKTIVSNGRYKVYGWELLGAGRLVCELRPWSEDSLFPGVDFRIVERDEKTGCAVRFFIEKTFSASVSFSSAKKIAERHLDELSKAFLDSRDLVMLKANSRRALDKAQKTVGAELDTYRSFKYGGTFFTVTRSEEPLVRQIPGISKPNQLTKFSNPRSRDGEKRRLRLTQW